MAIAKCLKDHAPVDMHHQNYVQPTYDLLCDVAGCSDHAVIWLNPEEVMDYERGSRTFWESSNFTIMKANNCGPRQRPWDALQVISYLSKCISVALQPYLKLLRGTQPVSGSQLEDRGSPPPV